ncbi:Slc24a1, partial [Symbiodinium sp. KB8]
KTNATTLYMSLEKRVYFSATTLKSEVSVYPQFLDDCALLGLEVAKIDLSEIPVHFKYLRSRFYELVAITAKSRLALREPYGPNALLKV